MYRREADGTVKGWREAMTFIGVSVWSLGGFGGPTLRRLSSHLAHQSEQGQIQLYISTMEIVLNMVLTALVMTPILYWLIQLGQENWIFFLGTTYYVCAAVVAIIGINASTVDFRQIDTEDTLGTYGRPKVALQQQGQLSLL